MTDTKHTAAQPLDAEHAQLLTKQVASWRAEIARLQDLIAHATGSTGAAQPLDLDRAPFEALFNTIHPGAKIPTTQLYERTHDDRRYCSFEVEYAWQTYQAVQARTARLDTTASASDGAIYEAVSRRADPEGHAEAVAQMDEVLGRATLAPVAAQQAAQTDDMNEIQRWHHNEFSKNMHTDPCGEYVKLADVEAVLRAQAAAKAPAAQAVNYSATKEYSEWFYAHRNKLRGQSIFTKGAVIWNAACAASPASTPEASQQAAAVAAPSVMRARVKDGCDCGCNDPVADTPIEMLEFLANRFEHAGVSKAVAEVYAHDIRKILSSLSAVTATTSEDARDVTEAVAAEVLHHIDQMYPSMWQGVPKTARTSVRNTIINQSNRYLAAMRATQQEGD